MTNPCNECIITSMCRDSCDYLEAYLDEYLLDFPRRSEYSTVAVATALRKEMIELWDGSLRGWIYIGQWKNYEQHQQSIERHYNE